MNNAMGVLIVEALVVYGLVLWAHALRHRFGPVHFYALIGGITAVMSWVTDAGLRVHIGGLTFNVGSTVFYTSLLLGVFVIYVFDGPRPTRILISTIVGVSILVPIIALVLNIQNALIQGVALHEVPMPSLRINAASVVATLIDLVFLAIVWEVLGQPGMRMKLWGRTFLTLLGVMWLDVVLFSTLAFAGTDAYWGILKGTLVSRLFVSIVAFPLLYMYIRLESRRDNVTMENRPVLAILRQIAHIREELTSARDEIQRRIEAEAALQKALSEVKTLRGLIPICASCKRIRDDGGFWKQLESYLQEHSDAEFSHGICPECMKDYVDEEPVSVRE
ncbi:MAG TPA: VUT family protein [Kiritimatiellia bacterium]|nr:VUT family protein [Kiritimatiellia bacterium]